MKATIESLKAKAISKQNSNNQAASIPLIKKKASLKNEKNIQTSFKETINSEKIEEKVVSNQKMNEEVSLAKLNSYRSPKVHSIF